MTRSCAKVGADISDSQRKVLLVVCDYSVRGFTEMKRLQLTTSNKVSRALKFIFGLYGIRNVLVTDNGPQFAVTEFNTIAKWGVSL